MIDKWLYNFFGFFDEVFTKIEKLFTKQKKRGKHDKKM